LISGRDLLGTAHTFLIQWFFGFEEVVCRTGTAWFIKMAGDIKPTQGSKENTDICRRRCGNERLRTTELTVRW